MTAATDRLGRIGEHMAARHLQRIGMTVVARNWQAHGGSLRGEIDLVARDGRVLVFCEVKTQRRSTAAGPLEHITPAKVRQLRRLAGLWLAGHGTGSEAVRIDAIGVSWPAAGGRPSIEHVRGIDAGGLGQGGAAAPAVEGAGP